MNGGTAWWRRILPKKHFKWRQPAAFSKLEVLFSSKSEKPWHKPLAASLVFLIIFSHWLGSRLFDPDDRPPMALLDAVIIAILMSIAFAYLLPWLISKCPVFVEVFEDHLVKIQGNMVCRYRFKNMDQYAIELQDSLWILTLQFNSGRQVTVGVPKNIAPEAVADFLSKAGLKRKSDLVPTNTPVPGMS